MEAYHKAQVLTMLATAQNQQSSGHLKEAYASARSAVALFNQTPVTGPSPEELKELSKDFQNELTTLEYFVDAHNATYDKAKKERPKQAVDYDRDIVARLVVEAKKLAEVHKFDKARLTIVKAENLVSKAIVAMEKTKTVVYDLKFKTKEDEYNYEIKRFNSYLELIPTAIDVKKPSKDMINLADKYVQKGKFYHEKSKISAAAGRWEEAIVVVKDGTKEVRRALRLLGVAM